MILLKFCTRPKVCVYRFLDFSIFMILRLFTTFMPFILWYTCSFVNHFSSHLFVRKLFIVHICAEYQHSCFSWILLCLIFCLCWLYKSMKRIKAFLFHFEHNYLTKYPVVLVSVLSFVTPLCLLSLSILFEFDACL